MDSFLFRAVEIVLAYGVLIALFWAFYDSWKFTPEQYQEARRMSRTPWLFIIGGAIVLNFSVANFSFSVADLAGDGAGAGHLPLRHAAQAGPAAARRYLMRR
jgi:hypothetical protein